jgi:hypothetical protein
MTIYVPVDLAEQVRKSPGFNASQVAQDAFRAALRTRAVSRDTVERLRDTISAEDARDRARWHALGDEWAREWASVRELEGLASFIEQGLDDFQPVEGHSLRAFLAERGPHSVGLGTRWRRIPRGPFLEAFAAGALEVWESVRDEVYGGGGDA